MSAPMKKLSSVGKLVFERSSFLNEKEKHSKRIAEHSFNCAVSVFVERNVFNQNNLNIYRFALMTIRPNFSMIRPMLLTIRFYVVGTCYVTGVFQNSSINRQSVIGPLCLSG